MQSYNIVSYDKHLRRIIGEVSLDRETIQGVYTYYMLCDADRDVLGDTTDLISKSVGLSASGVLPSRYQLCYTEHCEYPARFSYSSDRTALPFTWINYPPNQPKHHGYSERLRHCKIGGKAIGTKEDGVCRIVDLVSDNMDSYRSGILLMDTIRDENNSYYIYDLNDDGTTRNPIFFSRLHGFDWSGLPRELREIIMAYNPAEWLNVSKEYYNYILPLLGSGKLHDTNISRLKVMMECTKNPTPVQRQYIINRMQYKPHEVEVNSYITSNLFDPEIVKSYTNIVLQSNVKKSTLMMYALVNITYVRYLSKFIVMTQKKFDKIIEAAKDIYTKEPFITKDLYTSIITSITYITKYYNLRINLDTINWIIDKSNGCYTRHYINISIEIFTRNKITHTGLVSLINDYINRSMYRFARIYTELLPFLDIVAAGTLTVKVLDSSADYDDCFDMIETIIRHPSLESTNLGSILDDILSSTRKDIDWRILVELLQRPSTIVSDLSLTNIIKKRFSFINANYTAQIALTNTSVSYDNFKKIYDNILLKEYYESLTNYHMSMAMYYQKLLSNSQ